MRFAALISVVFFTGACSPPAERFRPPSVESMVKAPGKRLDNPAFWAAWNDGKAEISKYELVYPHRGKAQKGNVLAIVRLSNLSNASRAEVATRQSPDDLPVLKFSITRSFGSGLDEVHDVTTVYTALAPVNNRAIGLPSKLSFSRQESFGPSYVQAVFQGNNARVSSFGYSMGDATYEESTDGPVRWTTEEALALAARRLAYPQIKRGTEIRPSVMRSLERGYATRSSPVAQRIFWRSSAPIAVSVPAGQFQAEVFTARFRDAATRTYYVELDPPHRLLKWESSSGEKAQLITSERLPLPVDYAQ